MFSKYLNAFSGTAIILAVALFQYKQLADNSAQEVQADYRGVASEDRVLGERERSLLTEGRELLGRGSPLSETFSSYESIALSVLESERVSYRNQQFRKFFIRKSAHCEPDNNGNGRDCRGQAFAEENKNRNIYTTMLRNCEARSQNGTQLIDVGRYNCYAGYFLNLRLFTREDKFANTIEQCRARYNLGKNHRGGAECYRKYVRENNQRLARENNGQARPVLREIINPPALQ